MGRYLLGSDELEEGLHEVHIRHVDRRSLGVVGVDVPDLHVVKSLFIVVSLSILDLVLRLLNFLGNLALGLHFGFVSGLELRFDAEGCGREGSVLDCHWSHKGRSNQLPQK